MISSSLSITRRATAIVFSPERFCTSTIMPARPMRSTTRVSSAKPSSTRATSETRTTLSPSRFTTTSPTSSGVANSPGTRIV